MSALKLCVIPSFYAKYFNYGLFIPGNFYKKHIVSKAYCTAYHDDKNTFYTLADILLLGNFEEKLQKLDGLCFHINTWTVYIHSTSIDSVKKRLPTVAKCLTLWKEQSSSIKDSDEWTESRPSPERRPLRKKTENINWESSER